MKIKAVLFDLDGTLLPMDQDNFVKSYVMGLVGHLVACGYDAGKSLAAIKEGTVAMQKSNGETTNEEVFFSVFNEILGAERTIFGDLFDGFYKTEFDKVRAVCGFEPRSKEIIKLVRDKGLVPVLATNPLFPSVATESRIRWAGLEPTDFAHFTTYETYRSCKPSIRYYRDVLGNIGLTPEECVMVGNDVDEDMVAAELGLKTFLLTDCLLNRNNKDISVYPHGSFDELKEFINNL